MTTDKDIFIKSFPTSLTTTINSLVEKIEFKNDHNPTECFLVCIDNENFDIPYRIYYEEPVFQSPTDEETFILNCYFTRHNDGHVREKNLKHLIKTRHYFATPFILQLLGEYVQEIIQIVKDNLDNALLDNFVKFKNENPTFFITTVQRIESYWDAYYKTSKKTKSNYVGFQILNAIKEHERQTKLADT